MSVLETILAHKRDEVAADKKAVSFDSLKDLPGFTRPCVSLQRALRGKHLAIIAEIKKASPSQNVIREDFDPVAIAHEYQGAGASAISMLTDRKFFQGSLDYIDNIRADISIPILRKDFTVDPYQLYQSKAHGADAVLLIAAALAETQLQELHDEANDIGLECLVEIHSEAELESLDLNRVRLLGINNRDLKTFNTDLRTSIRLKALVPPDILLVSESGINTRNDVEQLLLHGIHAMLIGESLMRAQSPGKALAELLGKPAEAVR